MGDAVRWMVTGAGGALGTDLARVIARRRDPVLALTRSGLDVTDPGSVDAAVAAWVAGTGPSNPTGPNDPSDPAVLVNAAAFTAVDRAETDADAAAAAHAANAVAPGLLAAACARHGARMIQVSTDYVFPGDRTDGVGYEPSDATGPASVYGRTKAEGEQRVRAALGAHHVVRTAWVYGDVGPNFVRTMARLAGERETLDVVDDQHGSPTWAADLAEALVALGSSAAVDPTVGGTLHATGGGRTTWCGFARAVFAAIGADPARVRGCRTDQFPRPAPRPAWSVLSDASWRSAGLAPLRPWEDALHAALARHPDLVAPHLRG